jgi:tRNA A-37 threonylcarbamoyl transferase component Bud32/SAM-dependent methyltransferase
VKQQVKKGLNRLAPSVSAARAEIQDSLAETRRLAAEVEEVRALLAPLERAMGVHTRVAQLSALLAEVEQYQPIYGLPSLVVTPQRECRDRADAIVRALGDVLGLRVLDLGSSFAYMAFHLAGRGASAEAWDYDDRNTQIAQLTREINGLPVECVTRELTPATAEAVPGNRFDVVLLLSLLHHIVHFQGLDAGRTIVRTLLERVPILFVELAQAGEDAALFWDQSQPAEAMDIFAGLDAEIEVIGNFGTHLSQTRRPLVKVTRRSVVVHGRRYAVSPPAFEAYAGSPVRAMNTPRRYWRGEDLFIKEYLYPEPAGPDNENQIVNELSMLMRFQGWGSSRFPRLRDYCLERGRAVIVTDLVAGRLLDEDTSAARAFGVDRLAREVLESMAELEAHGIHHNDIRSWNVILGDQARLIDFGLSDPVARENEGVRLLWLLHAVVSGTREDRNLPDTELPDRAALQGYPFSLSVYDAVAAGERSPAALLALSRKPARA